MDWRIGTSAHSRHSASSTSGRARYQAPTAVRSIPLGQLLARIGLPQLPPKQFDDLLRSFTTDEVKDLKLYYSGDLSLLERPTVAIVGTRKASIEGRARARRLARELVGARVTIMSGLARGIDTEALQSAIASGGKTVAVIGTPLSRAYPAENARLQEEIYSHHLLVSPFAEGEVVFKSNFPKRNRIMAALSAATVIVEAGETSGTLHQATACQRLDRWLFLAKAVVDNPTLEWPARFIGKAKTAVLHRTEDVIAAIRHANA